MSNEKYNGLKVGDKVIANGYPGVVITLCGWSDTLIEVRLARGEICTDSAEVERR